MIRSLVAAALAVVGVLCLGVGTDWNPWIGGGIGLIAWSYNISDRKDQP